LKPSNTGTTRLKPSDEAFMCLNANSLCSTNVTSLSPHFEQPALLGVSLLFTPGVEGKLEPASFGFQPLHLIV
jgi:hypothetical protein